eukprot:gene7511-8345_t
MAVDEEHAGQQSLLDVPVSVKSCPSDLWKRKLKTLFYCIDADNNGYLNRQDCSVLAEKFRTHANMSEEDTAAFAEKLTKWWDSSFEIDKSYCFELLQFIECYQHVFQHRPSEFSLQTFKPVLFIKHSSTKEFLEKRIALLGDPSSKEDALVHYKPNLEMMFKAIDLNSDGIISLPEWKIYYKAMGIQDENEAESSFKIVDVNGDGNMSLDEYIAGAFDFMYSQEDSIYKNFLGPLKEL